MNKRQLKNLIYIVCDCIKADMEREQKLMEKIEIDKDDPKTIQNEKFKGTRFE